LIDVRNSLGVDLQQRLDLQIKEHLSQLITIGRSYQRSEKRDILLPDDVPRFSKAILHANARLTKEANHKQRQAARRAANEAILEARDSHTFDDNFIGTGSQDSITSHITVRPRIPQAATSFSSPSSSSDEIQASSTYPPPSSTPRLSPEPPVETAPARLEDQELVLSVRARRKRQNSGYYRTLLGGDSQEIKKAKRSN
jgi:hypothetical protein